MQSDTIALATIVNQSVRLSPAGTKSKWFTLQSCGLAGR